MGAFIENRPFNSAPPAVSPGDVYPVTLAGRLVASVVFFTGILLLAIPISVISTTFHAEYARVESMRQLRKDHAVQVEIE